MKSRVFITTAVFFAAGLFLFAGCSSDTGGSSKTDSFTEQMYDDIDDNTYDEVEIPEAEAEFASLAEDTGEFISGANSNQVFDMVLKDNIVYGATADGVLTYNLLDGGIFLIATESPVTALIDIGDKILVGGDNVYTLEGYDLSGDEYKIDMDGTVTALYRQNLSLFIGTTSGLYVADPNGVRKLAADLNVSGLTSDGVGIWVGTAGDGLYRWEGNSFHKRYLKRDSTLFDNVTALDYKHNHLYLGTDNGFYVHDGGSWTPFDLADGLPSETITAIDARDWVVRIGTASGPVTFFENEFKLMSKLEGMVITGFIKYENKLLAATSNAGLIMKSGGLVTTLFDGDSETTAVALEQQW